MNMYTNAMYTQVLTVILGGWRNVSVDKVLAMQTGRPKSFPHVKKLRHSGTCLSAHCWGDRGRSTPRAYWQASLAK